MQHRSLGSAMTLLIATVVVLGINWPIMKTGLESAEPLWFAVLRVGSAAAVIGVAAAATGRLRLPPRQDLPVVLSVGLLANGVHLAVLFTALQFVPAGRSSVLVWTAGLWSVPIAAAWIGERMTRRRWLGLVVGIAGLALLFEPWRFAWDDGQVVLGHLLLLGTAALQAAVIVHTRAHRWASSPATALPWQLLTAALPLVVVALVVEGTPDVSWSPGFTAIVAYQAVLATGFAAWSRQVVVASLRATTVALVLMAIPLVGMVSSMVALGERLTGVATVGVAGIGIGVGICILEARSDPVTVEAQPIE